jgi:mannose-6-phosphate isomerase-like protein (cupin superfamily)
MTAVIRRIIPAATFTFAVLALTNTANAQQKKGAGEAPKKASSLTWGAAPDAFPAGAKMAVEKGDPTKSGEFIVRLSFPAGYKLPPHWHPTNEHVRIYSGEFLVGMGDALDATKTKKLSPGDTGTVPAKAHHYAIAPVATELSVRAIGPFAMTYVHPKDDPRKKH